MSQQGISAPASPGPSHSVPTPTKGKKLIRPRGKRGGVKNRKPSSKPASKPGKCPAGPTEHSLRIARFHTLQKELARTVDAARRAEIERQQEELGGLAAYQDDSLTGGDKRRGGESGKWCANTLASLRGKDKGKMRVLDVGALSGTAYQDFKKWMDVTSIDINPRAEHVLQYDFFDFPVPTKEEDRYDVVGLSLVLNFIGDLAQRGQALIHAHSYLVPRGYLYLVLPLACVTNSRYLDHARLTGIVQSCGWDVVVNQDSKRLTRWLLQRKADVGGKKGKDAKGAKGAKGAGPQWDGTVWKEEIKVSATANNFCIRVSSSQQA